MCKFGVENFQQMTKRNLQSAIRAPVHTYCTLTVVGIRAGQSPSVGRVLSAYHLTHTRRLVVPLRKPHSKISVALCPILSQRIKFRSLIVTNHIPRRASAPSVGKWGLLIRCHAFKALQLQSRAPFHPPVLPGQKSKIKRGKKEKRNEKT